MQAYVVGFEDVDASMIAAVGGKGANLGELSRLQGVRVPPGFCVTTAAFDAGMTDEVAEAIRARLEPETRYAVRSSATAEDLPTASFAGQQDSYLNVEAADVLAHVELCWASLHTERAIAYRAQQGIDDAKMGVVVQQMVDARAAGVLFTADPLTGKRDTPVIEAVEGLGDQLVGGHVQAQAGVLTPAQAEALAALGRVVEAHFQRPQDIEWCLDDRGFALVQARAITTLFPIPDAGPGNRVYVSVGHQQMMTDAMKPLGLSVWQLHAGRPMFEAGGRLFVDLTADLANPATRGPVMGMLGTDPWIKDALTTVLEAGFLPQPEPAAAPPARPAHQPQAVADYDALVAELIANSEAKTAALAEALETKHGQDLFDFIEAELATRRGGAEDPRGFGVIMAGLQATTWLNDQLRAWIGEKEAATVLSLAAPHNPTSEMGLALMDVADQVRGGDESDAGILAALQPFLAVYGARGVSEIDMTRPRWAEDPTPLIALVRANLRAFAPGEAARKVAEGLRKAAEKEAEILGKLDGEQAAEAARMIRQLRATIGYREVPKFTIVRRLWLFKQAIMREVGHLGPDVAYLRWEELRHATHLDPALIARRKAEHARNERLVPPRVITSAGEALQGRLTRDDLPANALPGLPVSAGVVEGRARVIRDLADAAVEPGDILVTRFTDPGWTPLFVAIGGLVTEIGSLMTHGSVVAREYGLPAVVGVAGATTQIRDGQRIRVHGTDGYVELLDT